MGSRSTKPRRQGGGSKFFTNQLTVARPVRRVSVDLSHGILRELDERVARLNVSRQAVIKTLLRQALN
jgi:hypothetical protein